MKAVETQNEILHLFLMPVIATHYILMTACPGTRFENKETYVLVGTGRA